MQCLHGAPVYFIAFLVIFQPYLRKVSGFKERCTFALVLGAADRVGHR